MPTLITVIATPCPRPGETGLGDAGGNSAAAVSVYSVSAATEG